MPRGRSAELQQLYELPVGGSIALRPVNGTTIDALASRLRQVATRYLREGRAYRLEKDADHVQATRVPVGSHHKLSYLTDLQTGERWFAGAELAWEEKKALLARLDRMNTSRKGGGWYAEVDREGVWVRRWADWNKRTCWNEDNALPWPVPLTLNRS